MKSLLAFAVLAVSFSSFADSRLEDRATLLDCGGKVELRSYVNDGEERFALQFDGVELCSNVVLSTGKSYKLTDKKGNFLDKNITLSDEAVHAAKYGRLGITVKSGSGKHADLVSVRIKPQYVAPRTTTTHTEVEYESSEWQ